MKNLIQYKLFESGSKDYYEQTIKDIFQEVIDEFDINGYEYGNRYDAYNIYRLEKNKIRFWLMISDEYKCLNIKEYINDNIAGRLKSMGLTYNADMKILDQYNNMHYYNIDIVFPEEVLENVSDSQYHISLIKDLLSDVIDEFVIDDYDRNLFGFQPTGIYYHIYQLVEGSIIRVWIADMVDGISKQSIKNKEIKMSKSINDFEKRLINVGYNIDIKKEHDWYAIDIYT